ncbi:type II toxin-antitoxin system PemK/MazF family toxin [Flindersiella endophytica]
MQKIVTGGVYYVSDEKLSLPPESIRQVHEERRRFLVLSGSGTNSETGWLVVTGCPISGSTGFRTRFDVKLAANEAGVTKKCWVRVPAIQPLLKSDLEDLTGTLTADRLVEVQTRLLQYLGLVDQQAYEEPPF